MNDAPWGSMIAAALTIGILIGGSITNCAVKESYRRQAVKHGCGHFPVVDTLTGTTEFQWRNP